ncbi:S41 family peptidase [Agitococcus lubricus]|uniref:Carboxyl-terminal processing protease n=1 Tax=Agitococcus lubricus TaxID=1077255 RepID=A0A2T5IY67_9GAMM|nr:S41 family peptidase [Agitococcus lubricus]PTQ88869.1 carboxyl-terminal processing protease [Agitococcus lubricus]
MKKIWPLALWTMMLAQPTVWAEDLPSTPTTDSKQTKVEEVKSLPLTDLRTFVDVFERIRQSYVDPVDDKTLFENAIKGMLSALDPHSTYLDKNDYENLKTQTTGEFGGIGVEIGMEDGFLRVISPIDDTPASQAGIKAGDYIIKLEGKVVKGMTMSEAVDIMRGSIGQPLKLTIQRKGEPLRHLTLIRAKIEFSSVKSRWIAPDYAVLRISQFQNHTARDLTKALLQLKEKNANIKGVILDLRNNPGGVLGGAIGVADLFLDKGLVVYTKARTEGSIEKYEATEGQILPNIPLLVLVNGASASASEIVAGALQDHKRAIIAGTPTFGKGSVQTVLPLAEDKAIKLTTARYYTPNGRSIQAEGIKPDVTIEPAKLEIAKAGEDFKEADLKGHLANPNEAKAAEATNTFVPVDSPDPQVDGEKTVEPTSDSKQPAKTDKKSKSKSKTSKNAPKTPEPETVTDVTPPVAEDKNQTKADEIPSEKRLAEDDYVLYAALNVLKGAAFWQAKP